ncbi:hypothetical protein ABIB06_004901 [Bradyrhizobium sp. LB8.2]|uniref:hypothetical protein n=1 Tax=Bradyrhizobium sp. LB8.2 TaxID=3156330 RepID=UPI003392A76F
MPADVINRLKLGDGIPVAFAAWSPARLREFARLVQSEEPSAVRAWLAERGVTVRANAGVIETYSAIIDELTSSAPYHRKAASDFDARMLKSNLPRLTTSAEGAAVLALTLECLTKARLEQTRSAACAWQASCSPYAHFRDFAKRGFKP